METKVVTSILMDVLRIITPDEIGELTNMTTSDYRVPLTGIIEKKVSGNFINHDHEDEKKAKIIPLNENKESTEFQEIKPNIERVEEIANSLSSEIIKEDKPTDSQPATKDIFKNHEASNISELLTPETANKKENSRQKESESDFSSTVFILNEHAKSQKNQKKLKEIEVYGLYKKTASVSIEQEKKLKDDLSKSSSSGILVNKKTG